VVLFYRVLIETKAKFGFEMRGLALNEAWLTFYIKPANGLELPKIMQWLKQTFSVRFNVRTGRKAHLWGGAVLVGDSGGGAAARSGRGGLGCGCGGGKDTNPRGNGLRAELGQPEDGGLGGENEFFAEKPA
ncbi:MAG: hypothetical protein LBT00_01245, partial [Spirochaetaceae bacterium]|nr:hypothetical protein [Spirochaetaceae bacterium]